MSSLPVNVEERILDAQAAKRGGRPSPLGWIFGGRYRVWCQVAAQPYAVASLHDGAIKARFVASNDAVDYALTLLERQFEPRPADPVPSIPWRGPDLMTPSQAAERLGVTDKTLRNWARHGVLHAYFTPGGNRRYHRAEVDTLLWAREQHAAAGRSQGAPA